MRVINLTVRLYSILLIASKINYVEHCQSTVFKTFSLSTSFEKSEALRTTSLSSLSLRYLMSDSFIEPENLMSSESFKESAPLDWSLNLVRLWCFMRRQGLLMLICWIPQVFS